MDILGFIKHLVGQNQPQQPARQTAPQQLSVNNLNPRLSGGFTYNTPDQQINPAPQQNSNILQGINNWNGAPYHPLPPVNMPNVAPQGGFVPLYNMEGTPLNGWRNPLTANRSYGPMYGRPSVDNNSIKRTFNQPIYLEN